jgi:hypothetical protein
MLGNALLGHDSSPNSNSTHLLSGGRSSAGVPACETSVHPAGKRRAVNFGSHKSFLWPRVTQHRCTAPTVAVTILAATVAAVATTSLTVPAQAAVFRGFGGFHGAAVGRFGGLHGFHYGAYRGGYLRDGHYHGCCYGGAIAAGAAAGVAVGAAAASSWPAYVPPVPVYAPPHLRPPVIPLLWRLWRFGRSIHFFLADQFWVNFKW